MGRFSPARFGKGPRGHYQSKAATNQLALEADYPMEGSQSLRPYQELTATLILLEGLGIARGVVVGRRVLCSSAAVQRHQPYPAGVPLAPLAGRPPKDQSLQGLATVAQISHHFDWLDPQCVWMQLWSRRSAPEHRCQQSAPWCLTNLKATQVEWQAIT